MTYAMSDIHGNTARFNSIMAQIQLTENDTLYILGDVIDRYPDGLRILRRIMNMTNAKMLLGNHEYMMLNALEYKEDSYYSYEHNLRLWYSNGGKVTHSYFKHIRKSLRAEIFDYLKALPINIDIAVNGKSYKLVHGGPLAFYPEYVYQYDSPEEFAVWHRMYKTAPDIDGKTVIFGHTPTMYYQSNNPLEIWISPTGQIIGIDCGCGFPPASKQGHHPYYGRLACLRLDDMKIFYSAEEEKPCPQN